MTVAKPLRVVVLISGSGTNLQALIDRQASGDLPVTLVAVISNRPQAKGLERARAAGIETQVLDHTRFDSRTAFDAELQHTIDAYRPDLVVLAGFMRILTPEFADHYAGRMLNIHPSLLPKYQGLHTHERVLTAGEREHGVTVHFVTSKLDGGPAIMQAKVPVLPGDTPEDLARRVQREEHRIYPLAVGWFAQGRLNMDNGRALLDGEPLGPGGCLIEQETDPANS